MKHEAHSSRSVDGQFTYRKCTYCGTSEDIGVDRIDNEIGHIESNCVPACYRCNVTRGDRFSFEEMKEIGKTIKQIDKKRNGQEKDIK